MESQEEKETTIYLEKEEKFKEKKVDRDKNAGQKK